MLSKIESVRWARLKLLLVLPITGAMICISTLTFGNQPRVATSNVERQIGAETVAQDTTKRIPPPPPAQSKDKKAVPSPPPAQSKDKKAVPPPPPAQSKDKKAVPPPPPAQSKDKKAVPPFSART